MDPTDPLSKQPVGQKPTPSSGYGQTDVLLIGGGTAAVVGTQLYSKSYPHLAGHVFSNIVGGGKPTLFPLQLNASKGGIGLFTLPAPFGYADPVNYDLAPNYLANINYVLNQRFGLPNWVGIPESSFLKTLPDTHPDVKAGEYRLQGLQQIRRIRDFAVRASVEEVLDLYRFANSEEGKKYLYFPGDVSEDLEITIRARQGITQGEDTLRQASESKIISGAVEPPYEGGDYGGGDLFTNLAGAIGGLPRPVIRAVLDVTGLDPDTSTTKVVGGVTDPLQPGAQVATNTQQTPGVPNALQQEAMRRAPELLKQLLTERTDP